MPSWEAPCVELGNVPEVPSVVASPSPSEVSSASSPEPQNIRATPLFRALAMPPPDPEQPPGQEELERRLPGYRRIVIPRELTLIELLKQDSGASTDEEVLRIRKAKLRVVAERVGLRRLHVLAPRLRELTLDGSALSSLRDLGIGLIHLKVLSVNRCGLTCLDGVWGLSALRELHASGNRLQDLHPLAALQKLHTLDLANNPLSENRLWTLGVCGSLRRLTLSGTPASDSPEYRINIASTLPMLVYLDDRPMHTDIDFDVRELGEEFGSDSDGDGNEMETPPVTTAPPAEPEPGPSCEFLEDFMLPDEGPDGDCESERSLTTRTLGRRRPATTESAGIRPPRPFVPPRPRSAVEKPVQAPTRLHILNTLLDEEWRCSGSKLTSRGAVCGNLAQALRRPTSARRRRFVEEEKELVEETMQDAARAIAAEIPRAPNLEEWDKFRQQTGIDIDIDFNERPKGADPLEAIERLERIEKETMERINNEEETRNDERQNPSRNFSTIMNEYESWRQQLIPMSNPVEDVDTLFSDLNLFGFSNNRDHRISDNDFF